MNSKGKGKGKLILSTVTMILMSMLISMTVCMASVPDSEISIGGVSYGTSIDEVRSSYNAPDKVDTTDRHPLWRGFVDTYYYGTSFKVIFSNCSAVFISSTANNGLGTPSGIYVGNSKQSVIDTYGEPDNKTRNYYYYKDEDNNNLGMKFIFNSREKITAIYVGSFE